MGLVGGATLTAGSLLDPPVLGIAAGAAAGEPVAATPVLGVAAGAVPGCTDVGNAD